jgi:hypothetical protein
MKIIISLWDVDEDDNPIDFLYTEQELKEYLEWKLDISSTLSTSNIFYNNPELLNVLIDTIKVK